MTALSRSDKTKLALCGEPYHAMRTCKKCHRLDMAARRARAVTKRLRPRFAATKTVGPQCPECGSTSSRSVERGWSEPDDHFLRKRKCLGCAMVFATAEVVIPPTLSTFHRLDYRGREWRRTHYRRRYAKTDIRLPVRHSDYLKVNVRVIPNPELTQRRYCLRGHEFTPENTYTYPKSGYRSCMTCRRAQPRRRAA